jgi:arginine decarboxylase
MENSNNAGSAILSNAVGNIVPKKVFFTKGVGRSIRELESFESALRDAGISQYNLVRVSSIIPPNCEVITREKGISLLHPGGITFLVLARIQSDEPNRLLSASIGLALPKDVNTYGYLSEYEDYGESDEVAGEKSEDLAATMLASTLGISFDVDQSWDEKEQVFKMSGKMVKTSNVTQSAVVGKDGHWTCAVAAAVFIL